MLSTNATSIEKKVCPGAFDCHRHFGGALARTNNREHSVGRPIVASHLIQ
jgi:hypothetical protein